MDVHLLWARQRRQLGLSKNYIYKPIKRKVAKPKPIEAAIVRLQSVVILARASGLTSLRCWLWREREDVFVGGQGRLYRPEHGRVRTSANAADKL